MSEQIPAQVAPPEKSDRYKTLVVILTVLTTVLTAIVASLQADANIRSSVANRESQLDAILVAGEIQRESFKFTYDTNIFSAYLLNAQESNVLQITALEQEQAGDGPGSLSSLLRASEVQARADAARKFSVFFNDPRYAPATDADAPDMQTYLDDTYAAATELVEKQNAAADAYNRWNRKGDAYTGVLAILAISFFLFGLAQALAPRLRLLFAIFGVVAMAVSSFWAILIILS